MPRLWRGRHWSARLVLVLVIVYAVYAATAGLVAPPLARKLASEQLSTLTGRDVRIESVSVNPFLLRVVVGGFSVSDPQTELLAAFDRFVVDFELSSAWRRSWHFDRLALAGLDLRAQHNGDGAFNFDSLLAHVRQQLPESADEPAEPPPEDAALPAVSVRELVLADGALRFTEASAGEPQSLDLPVAFRIEDFSTRALMGEAEPPATAGGEGAGAAEDTSQKKDAPTDAEAPAATGAQGAAANRYAITLEGPDGGVLRWGGRFSLSPLQATGELAVEGVDLAPFLRLVRDRVAFAVPSGALSLSTRYDFAAEPAPRLRLEDAGITLEGFALSARGSEAPVVSLSRLAVRGASVDSQVQSVEVATVQLEAPEVIARLEADGLDLLRLFEVPADSATVGKAATDGDASGATTPAAPEADPQGAGPAGAAAPESAEREAQVPEDSADEDAPAASPWQVAVGSVRVEGGRVELTDATLDSPETVTLQAIDVALRDIRVAEETTLRIDGSLQLGDGRLRVEGGGSVLPLDLTLAAGVEDLDLARLAPWVRAAVPLEVSSGILGAELEVTASGETPDIRVRGSLSARSVAVDEPAGPLLRLEEAGVEGLDARLAGQSVAIARVALTGMQLTNRVDSEGLDAAGRITRGAGRGEAEDGTVQDPGEPWVVTIGQLRLDQGLLRHEDATTEPDFAFALHELAGSVANISTAPGSRIDVDISALVDDSAPLALKGKLAAEPLFADIKLSLDNYDMRPLTPFTRQILGYTIDKGQLGVDSTITLEDSTLQSGAEITANQFYLGDKVPSESAIKAPIKFGLSVLRNRQGRIRLPITIDGDINDPKFSVGGVIARTLANVIVKAATAPFSILSSLAGGRDLQQIPFAPGVTAPAGEALESLQALHKVLVERPGLNVTLTGNAGKDDRRALAAERLGRELAEDDWPGIETALSDAALREAVLRAYRSRFDRDRPEAASEADETAAARAAWEALLEDAASTLPRSALQALADARAEEARVWLLEQAGDREQAAGRLFTAEGTVGEDFSGLTLSLK